MDGKGKSWEDDLKTWDSERKKPPPKEFYKREKIPPLPDTDLFKMEEKLENSSNEPEIQVDPHFYSTSHIFDPEETEPMHHIRKYPIKDQGIDMIAWKKRNIKTADVARAYRHKPGERDYNPVTGQPNKEKFKLTIDQILKQRQISNTIEHKRKINPVSHQFPTNDLELNRITQEKLSREATVEYFSKKRFTNERRVRNKEVNIITGDAINEEAAKAIQPFPPYSDFRRHQKAIHQEEEIVEQREGAKTRADTRIFSRYNNGRIRLYRDFNIINGNESDVALNPLVNMKPSVMEWIKSESLQ